ncbi:MAG: hypothetical protein FJX62_07710 [Alphaproteobacteria bacterium]|nr:hypothetical protein [Alphaproteobacteria bacterium]
MLPSFRLIVAAFLCGFVVVFAGLRLAATLHHVHASMPIASAHAAALPAGALAEPPGLRLASPIVYDLRFVGGNSALAPLPVSLTPPAAGIDSQSPGSIDAALPHPLPLAEQQAPPPAVAAIDPDVTTRATPDDPPPEPEAQPDRLDDSAAEPPTAGALESDVVPATATEPAAPPAVPATKPKPAADGEPAAAEAAPAIVTGSVTQPPAVPAAPDAAAASDPAPVPAAATPEAAPATDGSAVANDNQQPVAATVPTPRPRVAEPAPKKKRARPVQRAAQDPFGFPFSN